MNSKLKHTLTTLGLLASLNLSAGNITNCSTPTLGDAVVPGHGGDSVPTVGDLGGVNLGGGGVIDSGGGELTLPTEKEVINTIKKVWKDVRILGFTNNPIDSFSSVMLSSLKEENISYALKVLRQPMKSKNFLIAEKEEKELHIALEAIETGEEGWFEAFQAWDKASEDKIDYFHASSTLGRSELRIADKCFDRYGVEKDASVETFKIGSPICFSSKRLMRVPKGSLEKQIIGLFVHEFAHLVGENEPVAHEMQNYYLANADAINKKGREDAFLQMMKTTLWGVYVKLDWIESLGDDKIKMVAELSKAWATLDTVSDMGSKGEFNIYHLVTYHNKEKYEEFKKLLIKTRNQIYALFNKVIADEISIKDAQAEVLKEISPKFKKLEKLILAAAKK